MAQNIRERHIRNIMFLLLNNDQNGITDRCKILVTIRFLESSSIIYEIAQNYEQHFPETSS